MYKLLIFSIDKVIHIKWLLLDLHVLCPSSANIPACLASLGLMQRTYDGSFDIRISINFARLVLNWVAVCGQQQHTSNEENKTQKGPVSEPESHRMREKRKWLGENTGPSVQVRPGADSVVLMVVMGGGGAESAWSSTMPTNSQQERATHARPMGCGTVGAGEVVGGGASGETVSGVSRAPKSQGILWVVGRRGPGRDSPSITASDAMHRGVDMGQRNWRDVCLKTSGPLMWRPKKKKTQSKASWFSPSLAAFCRSAPPCRSTRWGSCYLTGT